VLFSEYNELIKKRIPEIIDDDKLDDFITYIESINKMVGVNDIKKIDKRILKNMLKTIERVGHH